MKYLYLPVVALMCLAHTAMPQGKTEETIWRFSLCTAFLIVILEPNSPTYVCPSEQIILRCNVPVTPHYQLVWAVPDVTSEEDNTTENIVIFCNNMHPTRRGPYQPALIGCADGKIVSTLSFNVSREVNVTCWTGHGNLMEHVTVGPHGTYQLHSSEHA